MPKTTPQRTARRVVEMPIAARPNAPEPAAAAATTTAAAEQPQAAEPNRDKVRKLALIFNDTETAFDISRIERSTIERFRRAARNTPGLLDNADGTTDEDLSLDVTALIAKGYELLFGSAAALAVRARKLSPRQASAFVNPERIKKLVPRTEQAIEQKFGARLRDLPPLAQLSIDIVATLGLMLQDAATMDDDEPAPGAPSHAPGQEVRR